MNPDTESKGKETHLALSAGDVIQRGDLFRLNDGTLVGMDKLGRLLGLRCLGETLKKGGDWFRPSSKVH